MTTTAKRDNESEVKNRIGNDLANHVVTVLKSDGLYRHWRCAKPGDSNNSFEVITWPGSICITGDMGDYLFQRSEDMLAFMRRNALRLTYVSQKCVATGKEGIREFSAEVFEQVLTDTEEELLDGEDDETEIDSIRERIQDIRSAYELHADPQDAYRAMLDSDLFDGYPDCEELTYHFVWCLHALNWFIKTVDEQASSGNVCQLSEIEPGDVIRNVHGTVYQVTDSDTQFLHVRRAHKKPYEWSREFGRILPLVTDQFKKVGHAELDNAPPKPEWFE